MNEILCLADSFISIKKHEYYVFLAFFSTLVVFIITLLYIQYSHYIIVTKVNKGFNMNFPVRQRSDRR